MTVSIGVDLAQARDRTAIAAVRSYEASEETGEGRRARKARHHELIHLEKLRPGLSYPAQAEMIVSIAQSLDTDERPTLFVDATGVGRAVVDLLRAASPFTVRAVTLTAATDVVAHGTALSVPKAELVATLEVALSTRRLHASSDLPLAADLDRELRAFSYEFSASGRPLYGGVGDHDDLVIALALAVFGGSHGGGFTSARAFIDAVDEAMTRGLRRGQHDIRGRASARRRDRK